jgi:hypothetical protein
LHVPQCLYFRPYIYAVLHNLRWIYNLRDIYIHNIIFT